MRAIAEWMSQSDPATLRKLMVFAEYGDGGKITQYRAVGLAGTTQGCAVYGVGPSFREAIHALDCAIVTEAECLAGVYPLMEPTEDSHDGGDADPLPDCDDMPSQVGPDADLDD